MIFSIFPSKGVFMDAPHGEEVNSYQIFFLMDFDSLWPQDFKSRKKLPTIIYIDHPLM